MRGMMAAAAIGLAVFIGWVIYRAFSQYHFVSWRKLLSFFREAARNLRTEQFEPGLILGIGRGGSVMASMLGAYFPKAVVMTASRPHRKHNNSRRRNKDEDEMPETVEIPADLRELLEKREHNFGVLLVAESAYSGSTLYEASQALSEQGLQRVRTLSYGVRPGTSHPPDFFNAVTTKRIRMPWGRISTRPGGGRNGRDE